MTTNPPDGRGYTLMINFFWTHPHLLTKAMLSELFANIRIDKTLLHEAQILKLFHLANRLRSPVLANEMLNWFCDTSEASVLSFLLPASPLLQYGSGFC
jgi:hypothetical protein